MEISQVEVMEFLETKENRNHRSLNHTSQFRENFPYNGHSTDKFTFLLKDRILKIVQTKRYVQFFVCSVV